MAEGFQALFDELQQVAATIGTVATRAGGITWREPTGDYGHTSLQSAYGEFITGMKGHVQELARAVDEHGIGLKDVATSYRDDDVRSSDGLKEAGRGVGFLVGSAGQTALPDLRRGADSTISRRLNPDGPN